MWKRTVHSSLVFYIAMHLFITACASGCYVINYAFPATLSHQLADSSVAALIL